MIGMRREKKYSLVFTILLLTSMLTIFIQIDIVKASSETLHVGNGQTYTTIQSAINDANESDTIYVHSGTYNENIIINKQITLTGESKSNTNIIGNSDHTIKVTSNGVIISSFTIKNDGASHACIYLDSTNNCEISNNKLEEAGNSIHLLNSNSNTIKDNTIQDNNVGIFLSNSDSNTIKNNYIQDNNAYGVSISSSSTNNLLYNNHFSINLLNNARDLASNTWSYNSQGNYWDDYNDYDNNDDGIGDNPYIIDGNSQDGYPLGDFLNQDPVATIVSISPNPATLGDTINFQGDWSDDGSIITWEWKSDKDGIFGYGKNCQSSSLSKGTHTISFRIQDNDGVWSNTDTETLTINKQGTSNQKPTASIQAINPKEIDYGDEIYLHGFGSDSDGTIEEYQWRSDLDGIISTESTFSITDLSIGNHKIYFKVKDNNGAWSNEDSEDVIVNEKEQPADNNPPTADAGGPYYGTVDQVVNFDGTNSHDSDPGDSIASYVWDFGDGCVGDESTHGHIYSNSGDFTITLTVTDKYGAEHTDQTIANITTSSNNNQGNNGNNNNNNNNPDDKDDEKTIPGFELILVFSAVLLILLIKKKKKFS